jgi:hypothetical protein
MAKQFLADNQGWQEPLRDSILGSNREQLGYEQFDAAPLIEQTFKEVLRL